MDQGICWGSKLIETCLFPIDRNPEDCEWGDEAISGTHHGPLIYHLAKVDDAATTNTTGLNWFKIGQDGLDLSTGESLSAFLPCILF
jgi:hypothetical protein